MNSTVLASLLPYLPCLHSIRFLDVVFDGAEIPFPHHEPPRKIRSLEFRLTAFKSHMAQGVLDILSLFSHVDDLQLSFDDIQGVDSVHGGNHTASVPIPRQPLTISKLVSQWGVPGYRLRGYNPLLVNLAKARSVLIECLDVEIFGMDEMDWEDLGTLTHDNRTTVQTLIFKPRSTWFKPPLVVLRRPFLYMHSHLPYLQSLRSLTLHLEILNKSESESNLSEIWTLLSGSLLNLPTSLRHIKLVLLPQMSLQPEVMLPPIRLWSRNGLSWEVIRKAFDRLTALETATFVTDGSFLPTPNPGIHRDGVLEKIETELQLASNVIIRHETVERR